MKRWPLWALITVCLLAVGLSMLRVRTPKASGPLQQEAYVWQRAWNEPVLESVLEHGTNFSQIVALAAEVGWKKGEPELVRVTVDYEALRAAHRPAGIALRIGGFSGPFTADSPQIIYLADLAKSLVNEAQTNGVTPTELQLDFDCAESKLDGYRIWVEAIHQKIAPVPVCITALPSWLKRSAFKSLIAAADSYVLQAHSLERPRGIKDPFTLCDINAAKRAVERAARFGKPFRVALPTYGYVLAFNSEGRFAGISAEGPSMNWPAGVQLREVRASAQEMASLVQGWTTNRPQSLEGIIWYRLPVATDRLNWSWPTLAAVMQGRTPAADLRATTKTSQPGLVEIELRNEGEDAYTKPVQVTVSWQGARLLAADALEGFEIVENANERVTLKSGPSTTIAPGERRSIGWVRLDQKAQVQIELQKQ